MKLFKIVTLLFLTLSINLFAQTVDELNGLISQGKYLEAEKLAEKVPNTSENQDLLILKGDIYIELENYEEANKAYSRAYEIDDNIKSIPKYGKSLSLLGQYDKAEKVLNDGIDDFEENIEIRLELANNYIRAGKLTDAEVQIKRAEDIKENDPRIYITEGDMYFNQRVYELSKKSYEKALSIDPNLKEAREKLATSYYWLANREVDKDLSNELFTMSLKEWDKVTKQDSMDANAFYNKGKILYLAKMFKDAVPALYRYYQLRPDGKLGRWYLAQSLYELGMCDSAAPQLKYASENIDSVKFKSLLMLARCYYDNKKYSESEKAYEAILSLDKNNPEFEVADSRRYGTAKLFTGDTTGAIAIYKELTLKDPNGSCNLMNMVGKLMLSAKKYDVALFFFTKRLETGACSDSTDAQINYFLGLTYLFMEQRDSAITYLEKSFKMDSLDASPLVYLGDAYVGLNDEVKAIDYFEKAINLSLTHPDKNDRNFRNASAKLSGLYFKSKNWSKLLNIAKKWAETDNKDEYAALYTAIAYQGAGDIKNACLWYGKVLQINPNNKNAKNNRAALGCE